MKNSNIIFASLIILGLIISLSLGCRSELSEVVDLEIQEESLTASLHDNTESMGCHLVTLIGLVCQSEVDEVIDLGIQEESLRANQCIGCHLDANFRYKWEPSTNDLIPDNVAISYYEDYVSKHTKESAAMNNIDIEGLKKYIAKYK